MHILPQAHLCFLCAKNKNKQTTYMYKKTTSINLIEISLRFYILGIRQPIPTIGCLLLSEARHCVILQQ